MNDTDQAENGGTKPEGKVEGTIKAVTGLLKGVPVYQDAIQPVAKETGTALQTVGQAVNAALAPICGLVWGIEKIEEFVNTKVTEKLSKIPEEKIQTPDPSIAGPALESLRYTGHNETLRELYANLLATSMDADTAKNAHPGFVEIIRSMSSDEAKIITFIAAFGVQPMLNIRKHIPSEDGNITVHKYVSFIGGKAGCEHKELMTFYFDNLLRLKLIEIPDATYLTKPSVYDDLEADVGVKKAVEQINSQEDSEAKIEKIYVGLTELGKQFSRACVIEKT